MWLTEVGVTVKCKWSIMAFYIVLCKYIVVILLWVSSVACKLYVGYRRVIFICHSAVECFNCIDLCTLWVATVSLLPRLFFCMRREELTNGLFHFYSKHHDGGASVASRVGRGGAILLSHTTHGNAFKFVLQRLHISRTLQPRCSSAPASASWTWQSHTPWYCNKWW